MNIYFDWWNQSLNTDNNKQLHTHVQAFINVIFITRPKIWHLIESCKIEADLTNHSAMQFFSIIHICRLLLEKIEEGSFLTMRQSLYSIYEKSHRFIYVQTRRSLMSSTESIEQKTHRSTWKTLSLITGESVKVKFTLYLLPFMLELRKYLHTRKLGQSNCKEWLFRDGLSMDKSHDHGHLGGKSIFGHLHSKVMNLLYYCSSIPSGSKASIDRFGWSQTPVNQTDEQAYFAFFTENRHYLNHGAK